MSPEKGRESAMNKKVDIAVKYEILEEGGYS